MQSPEFNMKAQQTRREGQIGQKSTPGLEANVKTRNNAHGNLAPEAEKREPENEVEHMVDKNYVIWLNNFAPEESFFFGGGGGQPCVDERSKILE